MPLVGIDPAVTLTYRDEYRRALPGRSRVQVQLLQEWLSRELETVRESLAERRSRAQKTAYHLMGHCTERTAEPGSQAAWQKVFEAFGLELVLEPVGCCGMCGVYGHEAEHVAESRGIYAMSWQKRLPEGDERRAYLAAGHSCRSQVHRFDGEALRHPAEALLDVLRTV
jgi:Fe-S oxidoreductase